MKLQESVGERSSGAPGPRHGGAPVSKRIAGVVRFALRTAGFVGLTAGVVGLLELDGALAADAAREAVFGRWKQRYGRSMLRLLGASVEARGSHVGVGAPLPGRDARGIGRIFVMNHRSMLDIFVTLAL